MTKMKPNGFDVSALATMYAHLPYAVRFESDTCGGSVCVMAYNPELSGCMAQGATPQEALENLKEARQEYIASLLADGMPVPTPEYIGEVTRTSDATFSVNYEVEASITIDYSPLLEVTSYTGSSCLVA